MRRWPPKWQVLEDAFAGKYLNKKTKRLAKHYKCASCKDEFPSSQVEVDHINPVVDPVIGFTTWDDFISRLFVDASQLQTLCKPCHKIKTSTERVKRDENK